MTCERCWDDAFRQTWPRTEHQAKRYRELIDERQSGEEIARCKQYAEDLAAVGSGDGDK